MTNKLPYGFVYKTVLPDGRYYIGQHKISNHQTMDKDYFGSGVIIKDYIKAKGKDLLKREILEFAFDHQDLCSLEKKIITESVLNDEKNINLDYGGKNNYTRTQEVIKKISETVKRQRKENPAPWLIREGKENNKSKNWKLISPDGIEYNFCGGLSKFCQQHNLSAHTLKKAAKEGWIPKRGKCAGWKIFDLDTGNGTYRETLNHGETHSGKNNPWYKNKIKEK
jgi:hypothetical protein